MSTWNRTGTIALTNASATVTGTGVDWSDVSEGDALHAPDGAIYEIASVTGSTLTLVIAYAGSTASGQAYAIQPTRGVLDKTRTTQRELIEAVEDLLVEYGLPLQVAKGGTGATTQSGARGNLGLVPITSQTDTTAGRLLTPGAFGIGAALPGGLVTGATGIRDLPAGTAFGHIGGTAPGDAPSAAQGAGIVIGSQQAIRLEIWSRVQAGTGKDRLYLRTYASNGETNGWTEIYNQRSILGPVSQSGGVPTGAQFQYGSNANGEFLRFPDGTQLCWHALSSNTGGNTFWTYPAAFSVTPRASATPIVDGAARISTFSAIGASSLGFSIWNIAGSRVAASTSLIAVGRWY